MDASTIEIVSFSLKGGVDDEEFRTRNREVEQNFVSQQPGFVSRETARAEDGSVVVLLHWESPEAAQGSMDKFVDAPETQEFTALIDMDTFKMTRYAKVA